MCGGVAALMVVARGVDPLTAYLATSPGGSDSIAIIAASTNVDVSFVMAMQTFRMIAVHVPRARPDQVHRQTDQCIRRQCVVSWPNDRLHDMTAGELLAAYKTRKLSPVEAVDAVIARIEAWEPRLKALYAPDFEGARKAAKAAEKRWQAGQAAGRAGRRADHHQGEHRHQGRAGAAGHRGDRFGAGGCRCAGGGAGARGGRDHPGQDHHARLRHAVFGPQLVPSADAQSLEPRVESRRLERRRGRGGGGRLRPAASRHRHRRLGAPAGVLERHLHPEAQPRPGAGRSAVFRPGGRADDAHGRRLRLC